MKAEKTYPRIMTLLLAMVIATAGYAATVVATPGRMQTLLRDVDTSGTLIIKGTIDARDLVALRDLAVCPDTLDLSAARLKAVASQTEVWVGRCSYDANRLPEYIFMQTGFKHVSMPFGLVSIGTGAFTESAIESVTMPKGLTTIGDFAFRRCESLKEVDFPASVTTVGKQAFAEATSLERIGMETTLVEELPEGFAAGATSLMSISLPASLKNIGAVAFSGTKLESVDAGTARGDAFALAGMKNLVATTINNAEPALYLGAESLATATLNATEIPDAMFAGCKALDLTSVLEETILIGDYSFAENGAETLVLPSVLSAIGNGAFSGMTSLKLIDVRELEDRIPDVTELTFEGLDAESIELFTSEETVELWKEHPIWGAFKVKDWTGIELNESTALTLSYSAGALHAHCSEPMNQIAVYSASGKLLALAAPRSEEAHITVNPEGGMLVVTIDTTSHRYVRKLMTGE